MFKKGVHSAVFYTHCVKVFGILQFLPYCVEEIGLSAVVGSLCYHTALQKERYGVAHCVQVFARCISERGDYCICSFPDCVEENRILPAVYDTAFRNSDTVDNTLNLSVTRHLAVSLKGVDTSFLAK